jgi:hypothetical protein
MKRFLEWDGTDDDHMAWYDFQDALREWVGKCQYWHCRGVGLGWQKREGYKWFVEKDGAEITRHILPNTDNHFKVYKGRPRKDGYHWLVVNSHHDAMGEQYYLTKVPERQFRSEV